MHRRHCLAILALTASAALATGEATAQDDFPGTRPIRLVVGFVPGGPADAVARLLAQRLNALLGVPVVVENRPGAGGTLAAGAVARAPADGRTLLLANSGHSGTKALYPALPYDPVADFAAVAGVAATPNVVLVKAGSRFRTIQDLVAAARAKPGDLNFGAGGGGPTLTALSAELLKRAARIDAVQVNYAGSGPASLALLSGEIDFSIDTLSSAIGQVEQGQVKGLAVTARRRAARLPAGPTLDETVAPGFDVTGWFGVLAPAGTPAPVVERLNRDLNAALETPAVVAQLGELGLERIGGSAESFAGLLRSETERWGGLIRELGLKPE